MARTSVANTIQRIRRQAAGGFRNELNVLTTTLGTSDTSVVLDYDLPAGMKPGAVISIDIETMRIVSVDTATRTIVVIRGWLDSDGAAHTSGAEVWLSPRYPPLDIFDAMIAEVQSWGPQLYRPFGSTISVAITADSTELPATFLGAYGLVGVRRNWSESDSTAWPDVKFRFQRGVGTTWTGAATAGLLIRYLEPVYDGSVYVTAAMPFYTSLLTYTADLVTDVGLAESQLDVLEMGVKLRLGMDNESNRTSRTAQDEPRRAEETPAGSAVPGFQFLNALYRQRKQEEITKLRSLFPIRYS